MAGVNLQKLCCVRKIMALFLTSLVAITSHGADGPVSPCHQFYPNIPGETLLDNDTLVVQRFIIPP